MFTTTRALLATALLGALALSTAIHAQSLSDVAKKAEEARAKGTNAPAKVYTNSNLVAESGDAVKPTAPPAGGSAAPELKEPNEIVQHDEAHWKGQTRVLRGNLDRDREACVPLAAKVQSLENALAATQTTMVQGNQIVPAEFVAPAAAVRTKLADAVTELRQCTAKVTKDERAITDFEEEARRAGVLPGWLR